MNRRVSVIYFFIYFFRVISVLVSTRAEGGGAAERAGFLKNGEIEDADIDVWGRRPLLSEKSHSTYR